MMQNQQTDKFGVSNVGVMNHWISRTDHEVVPYYEYEMKPGIVVCFFQSHIALMVAMFRNFTSVFEEDMICFGNH